MTLPVLSLDSGLKWAADLELAVGVAVGVGVAVAFALASEPFWEAALTGTARIALAKRRLQAKPGSCLRKGMRVLDAARQFKEVLSITIKWSNSGRERSFEQTLFSAVTPRGAREYAIGELSGISHRFAVGMLLPGLGEMLIECLIATATGEKSHPISCRRLPAEARKPYPVSAVWSRRTRRNARRVEPA